MMASTINNPFMMEHARVKRKQIEEIEASLVQSGVEEICVAATKFKS